MSFAHLMKMATETLIQEQKTQNQKTRRRKNLHEGKSNDEKPAMGNCRGGAYMGNPTKNRLNS